MTSRHYTNEQILGFLCQADLGVAVRDLCERYGFSERLYHQWRARMVVGRCSLAQRLIDLEMENARLWRLVKVAGSFSGDDDSSLQWPKIEPPEVPKLTEVVTNREVESMWSLPAHDESFSSEDLMLQH
jgi:putative transposase